MPNRVHVTYRHMMVSSEEGGEMQFRGEKADFESFFSLRKKICSKYGKM